jgi:prophage regulatory protein
VVEVYSSSPSHSGSLVFSHNRLPQMIGPSAVDVRLLMVASQAPRPLLNPIYILRLPEVISRVGLKRASIYQYISQGLFPKQISLGERSVGWLEHEINEWLATRIKQRKAPIQKTT